MLIWGCSKVKKEYSLSFGLSGEGTLCDAKPKGSTEGSTEWVSAPYKKTYAKIHEASNIKFHTGEIN